MTTKSQPHNRHGDEVYKWIRHLQKHPEDEAVQEKVIKQYEELVKSIAKKYSKNSTIYEDLTQVGMLGLMAAIRRYDPSYGKSFEAFAIPTMVGEIKRYIRDKTWSVHVPRRIKELGPKIKRAAEELTTHLQRSPSVREIADHLGTNEEDVLEAMEMSQSYRALSVDHQVEADSDGSTVSILDLVGKNESGYDQVDFQVLLKKLLPILTEREQEIIQYTFFENMSQKEAGEKLGISQMHVSRLQRRALRKLREALQSDNTEVFF
ncbi:MAG: RNA polymerase sigma factor SigB [Bacillaceae bacterium]|nr:RNA polymerase sigma factor SigB [Bacillaceae bacterium]